MQNLYKTYEHLKNELQKQQETNPKSQKIKQITQKIQRIESEIMSLNGMNS